MKSDLLSKLSASFFVLVMALSTLVVLPVSIEAQTPGTNDIQVPILGKSSQAVPGASVILTNVHTGETRKANYLSGLLFDAPAAPAGFYKVDVTADGYYSALDAIRFRFDALSSNITAPIQLLAFPDKDFTWNVTVNGPNTGSSVTVGFYDAGARQLVSSKTTSIGYATVTMFDTTTPGFPGPFYLYVKAATFEPYLAQVNVTASQSTTVTLTQSTTLAGIVKDTNGNGANNVVAYLLNTNPSIPWIKRLLKSPASYASFTIDAYPGTYWLSIKGDGLQSKVQQITIATPPPLPTPGTYVLPIQTQREELTNITFGSDYTTMTLALSTTWAYDEPFPGFAFSDAGSLRMQIDLNGNADGTVDASENFTFFQDIGSFGPKFVTTAFLLKVNKSTLDPTSFVYYKSALTMTTFNLGSVIGSIDSLVSVPYSYSVAYSLVVPSGVTQPPTTSSKYTLEFNVTHDTSFVNYVYSVGLMAGFELVKNSTTDSKTVVSNFHRFTINPANGTGPVTVGTIVEKGIKPIAKFGMDESAGTVYAKKNGSVVLKYFVRVGGNATFTANGSSDPNGNPLTYEWQFGDGTSATTSNKTFVHVYASAENRTVNLTVRDVLGITNQTSINITCDALEPRPHITMKNRTLVDNKLYLKQGEAVIMNASRSYDDARTVGDGWGLINTIQFVWGDGNSTGKIAWADNEKNATWSYARAGTYTVWLNVTDVTGHHKNVSMTVQVNDTEAPKTAFVVENRTWGGTLVEQQTLYFIATSTTDNTNNRTVMSYSWSFGDGNYDNGTGKDNVTHAYSKLGTYTVSLNVTDTHGNYLKVPKIINVVSKPRPNLNINNVSFTPGEFTEGSQGTIVVNITNVGDAVATEISVTFYVQNPDGTQKLLSGQLTIYNGSSAVTDILPGGKAQARFLYKPSTAGTYIVTVNVTSKDQLEADTAIQSGSAALLVHQAAWKAYALWGGVIGVIILVPLLIYLSRRWSKRERKGPRREKKAEEKEE